MVLLCGELGVASEQHGREPALYLSVPIYKYPSHILPDLTYLSGVHYPLLNTFLSGNRQDS